MADDIDYGRCEFCGLRFYTYSFAWPIYQSGECPRCKERVYLMDFTWDFIRAIEVQYYLGEGTIEAYRRGVRK